jgi:streptogramin lyase
MTGKIRAATLAALASSVLVLCSCEDCGGGGGGPGGVGAPCVEHDDCQAGLFCGADGLCYDPNATDGDADADDDGNEYCVDRDGDRYDAISGDCPTGLDCNDDDPTINPDRGEACDDGVDNNCDGQVDEPSCHCDRGETQECYSGPAATLGRGACRAGLQVCGMDQTFGECLGDAIPAGSDECGNIVDDDCDGSIDEDCDCDPGCRCEDTGAGPECECHPPINQPCYSGPPSTGSAGLCHGGLRDCLDSGGGVYRWSACEGEVLPSDEVCDDGLDQDCDNTADDGCTAVSDADGDGYTVAAGDCDDADPERNPGVAETCNGYDDDCDADIDETCDCEPGDTQVCYTGSPGTEGQGVCQAGTQTCEGTEEFRHWGACAGELIPSVEVCDGVDNDCDGEVDERWALGSNGCGECVFEETVCDEADDDCDGLVDEGLVNACGLCPPEPCFTEDYTDPGDCEHTGRGCDGTGPWEDDPTAITLTQGIVRTPLIYIAVNSRAEVAQLNTETGAKNWQMPSHGSRPSRTAVAWDYSVWVGNRCYDGDYNNPACSNAVHLDIDGNLICRADVTGIARGLAIDADGYVWVGTWTGQQLWRIDPDEVDYGMDPPRCRVVEVVDVGVNVYGLAVDGDGYVWTASDSGSVGAYTVRMNTRDTLDISYYPNPWRYGITVDLDGNIWMGGHSGSGPAHRFTPPDWSRVDTDVYNVTGIAFAPEAVAGPTVVAPGPEGIWGSQYNDHRVVHIDPATMTEACSAPISCADGSGYSGSCINPHGVAALADGTIWVPIRFGGFVDVFDRNCNLLHVYEVDAGEELYTYSDMAGTQLMTVTARQGHWIQAFDSGYDDPFWSSVTWTADPLPAETEVDVTVVGAETEAGLTAAPSAPCGPYPSVLGANEAPLFECAAIQGLRWVLVDVRLATTRNEIRPVVRDVHVNWAY